MKPWEKRSKSRLPQNTNSPRVGCCFSHHRKKAERASFGAIKEENSAAQSEREQIGSKRIKGAKHTHTRAGCGGSVVPPLPRIRILDTTRRKKSSGNFVIGFSSPVLPIPKCERGDPFEIQDSRKNSDPWVVFPMGSLGFVYSTAHCFNGELFLVHFQSNTPSLLDGLPFFILVWARGSDENK